MILPTIRASFSRSDAQKLVHLLGSHDPESLDAVQDRLDREGLDSLLDDPRTRNALLTHPFVTVPPELIVYVLVRQALLEGRLESRALADYVASMVFRFGESDRAFRAKPEEPELRYLVDILLRRNQATEGDRFVLDTHLGNFALWLAGLFPQWVESRESRKGAPSLQYYEKVGARGFHRAALAPQAQALGVHSVLALVSQRFRSVRVALNRISDRLIWPSGGNPAWRLLRQIEQGA